LALAKHQHASGREADHDDNHSAINHEPTLASIGRDHIAQRVAGGHGDEDEAGGDG